MKLKPLLVLAVAVSVQTSHGQNFFTKGISKLAKVVGGMQTEKVASLEDAVITVNIGSNLHTDKLGTISQTFFNGWKSGGELNSIMFTKKSSGGYFKIDGAVNLDGKPMDYLTVGTYGMITEANPAARKFEILTSSGQKASFKVEPSKKRIKLLSIDGKKDGEISIDLSKDMTLELEVPPGMENQMMKVSLAINQLSIKSIYDVCYMRIAPKVVIPAGAFRNLNITPASSVLYSYKNSYLSVGTETMEDAKEITGHFKDVKYTAHYTDGKLVTVAVEPKLNTGLVFKETDKQLDMKYEFFKPNAFRSRPFDQLKSVGVNSFAIRGTTYHQSSSTSTSKSETATTITTTTTTTTITLQFPMQPDSVWDALLERLYPDFTGVVQSELGAAILPLETITHTEAYKNTKALAKDDANTKVNFARAFRDTKVMSAFMPVAEGYGSGGINNRVLEQAGADGLLSMTIDLEISSDGKLVLMVPKFGFEIVGKSNGLQFDTKYCSGSIQSATGVSFKPDITGAELEKIIRKSDMLAVFRKGLHELIEKEKANGDYGPVWALQK
jgi:hypothetical protein